MPQVAKIFDHQPSTFARTGSSKNFVDSISIQRGDVRVLGRYLLQAEAEAAAMGLSIRKVSLAELRQVLDANIGSWGGVAPAFDDQQTICTEADLGMFIAYDPLGRAIAACGQRHYDLGARTLKQAIVGQTRFRRPRHALGEDLILFPEREDALF